MKPGWRVAGGSLFGLCYNANNSKLMLVRLNFQDLPAFDPLIDVGGRTNGERAEEGEGAAIGEGQDDHIDDIEDSACDMIANILHYAHSKGFNVGALVSRAAGHFIEETNGIE